MEDYPFYAGIDVAKDQLQVALRKPGSKMETWQVAYDGPGVRSLVKRLVKDGLGLVTLEATGGLQRLVARRLEEAGLHVAVLNPRRVLYLARGMGKLAKTDDIDARFLAEIAERHKPVPRPLRNQAEEELADLNARRRQLQQMLLAEENHLRTASPATRQEVAGHVRSLAKRLKAVQEKIAKRIAEQPILRAKNALLISVPAIGAVTSAALLGYLPELGTIDKGRIGALVGVVPFNNDSGQRRGQMSCWGGRAEVRQALYMPTVVATRYNPLIKAFYRRLRANGKPPMVALIACMHKMLAILNAMLRDNKPWVGSRA